MPAPDVPGGPRLVPELPLPPYTYVSGQAPHPVSHPDGHRHGVRPEPVAAPDPSRWQECRPYLYGIDLFNCGYYWEAHETWEQLWHACGRAGPTADFLRGLIKLAAAGVKVREGRPEGVRSHAGRAARLFQQLAGARARFMGLALSELITFAAQLAERPETARAAPDKAVQVVFPVALIPSEGATS
jgi:hypothetical protein